jgi:hypothetical protein
MKKIKVVGTFVWLLVTDIADEVFESKLFDIYVLHHDGSESLVESYADIRDAIDCRLSIGIEVGHVKDIVNQFKPNKI